MTLCVRIYHGFYLEIKQLDIFSNRIETRINPSSGDDEWPSASNPATPSATPRISRTSFTLISSSYLPCLISKPRYLQIEETLLLFLVGNGRVWTIYFSAGGAKIPTIDLGTCFDSLMHITDNINLFGMGILSLG